MWEGSSTETQYAPSCLRTHNLYQSNLCYQEIFTRDGHWPGGKSRKPLMQDRLGMLDQ